MAVKKMEHVGVMVKNIERSAEFYEKILGLKLKRTLTHTNGVIRLAFLDDVDREAERIRQLGVRFIDKDITTLPNGDRYIFFHGPDGEWIEIYQPAHLKS